MKINQCAIVKTEVFQYKIVFDVVIMDKTISIGDGWELPPLRSLYDFLLESSRFQLPNFRDFEKWGNRVVNNLVYYQTNYLYMCIAILLVVA